MKPGRSLSCIRWLVLAAIIPSVLLAQPIGVDVTPATQNIARFGSFSVSVTVGDVTGLQGSRIVLSFDNTLLRFDGATNGGIYPDSPLSAFQASLVAGTPTSVPTNHHPLPDDPLSSTWIHLLSLCHTNSKQFGGVP